MKRRGERLRRRRRLMIATLAAITLVLPAAALATFLDGTSDNRDINLAVAGPPPTGEVAGAGATAPAPEETTTTTAEDQLRVEAGHGKTEPATPGSSVPGGDPVLRRPGATNPAPSSGDSSSDPNTPIASEPALPPPPTVSPPTSASGAVNCLPSEVRVTVTTDKTTYAPAETVRGSTTIANRSASACLRPTRGFVRIMNAAGRDVSGFAYTMEYRSPVLSKPGKTFTTPFM